MTNSEKITTQAIDQLLNYFREKNDLLITYAPLCISYTSDEKQILGMVTGLLSEVISKSKKGDLFYCNHPSRID